MKIVRGREVEFVAASHENTEHPGVMKRVLATCDDLQHGQVMMVNWARLPKGSSFQKHYHQDMQEVFVLLDGPVTMMVEERSVELDRGDAVIVDPGRVHQMTNISGADVDYVVFGISRQEGGQTVVVPE